MKRKFDAKIWKTGNAYVITIPSTLIKRFEIKNGEFLEITVAKDGDKKVK